LASDWAKYNQDLEAQRGLEDLKKMRVQEEKERKDLERRRIA